MDIISILQKEVDNIAKEKYKNDSCKPTFIVSVYQKYNDITGKINNHKILLTVVHNGISHSRVIFPVLSNNFGYESLEKEIEWLYNSTM